ncbi:MAG: hypothetical protein ACK4N5_17025, partial [Myxococcales bacterium]
QSSDAAVLEQIEQMWSAAQSQLAELREAVTKAQQLGRAGEQLQKTRSEREQAMQKLGEAFFKLAGSGSVEVPAALKRLVAEAKAAEEKLVREQSDLSAMLEEADAHVPAARTSKKKR